MKVIDFISIIFLFILFTKFTEAKKNNRDYYIVYLLWNYIDLKSLVIYTYTYTLDWYRKVIRKLQIAYIIFSTSNKHLFIIVRFA